ncbi:hypothetical protein I4U23_026308 [Adineta vaga]|nr:hypothetical protein I4U23_026308 [Adineta vaga]
MGNTPTCSSKPSSSSKNNTSSLYKLKTSSPLPTRIHHYKEQISVRPIFSQSKIKDSKSPPLPCSFPSFLSSTYFHQSMASATPGSANGPKKRNAFLSHFLSTRNLSIFRNKTATTTNNTLPISKESQHYKSQLNINTQQTPIPMCIGRGWLKKRMKRPVSLDLDLVKTLAQQSPINVQEQTVEEYQQPLNDIGNSKEKNTDKTGISIANQIIDIPIKQTGKYSSFNNRNP